MRAGTVTVFASITLASLTAFPVWYEQFLDENLS
jgi:hypothetical protein